MLPVALLEKFLEVLHFSSPSTWLEILACPPEDWSRECQARAAIVTQEIKVEALVMKHPMVDEAIKKLELKRWEAQVSILHELLDHCEDPSPKVLITHTPCGTGKTAMMKVCALQFRLKTP